MGYLKGRFGMTGEAGGWGIKSLCIAANFLCITAMTAFVAIPGYPAEDVPGEILLRLNRNPENSHRQITTVEEKVFYEGRKAHTARIVNRAVIAPRGEGEFLARFQTSEEAVRGSRMYRWSGEETARYRRGKRGSMEMLSDSILPVLRGFPGFPEEPVPQGGQWRAKAREVHDFRETLGSDAVVRFPVQVHYVLEEIIPSEKELLARITAEYNVFHTVETPPRGAEPPIRRITGTSRRSFLWRVNRGRLESSRETFTFVFELAGGSRIEYTGSAETQVRESVPLDRGQVSERIAESLDVEVEARDDGVAILLEDILFSPDSPQLREDQRPLLDRVGRLLTEEYPGREIRVVGHAARVGKEEYLQNLSEERALAVAGYLIEQGVRRPEEIWVEGRGSREPRGSNQTEEGRIRNRRVEIIILDEQ